MSPDQQPIQEVELWDLVSAFGRVLKAKHAVAGPESIRYDETPIHVYMQRIDERLRRDGRVAFTDVLRIGRPQDRRSSACSWPCSNWCGISTPAPPSRAVRRNLARTGREAAAGRARRSRRLRARRRSRAEGLRVEGQTAKPISAFGTSTLDSRPLATSPAPPLFTMAASRSEPLLSSPRLFSR